MCLSCLSIQSLRHSFQALICWNLVSSCHAMVTVGMQRCNQGAIVFLSKGVKRVARCISSMPEATRLLLFNFSSSSLDVRIHRTAAVWHQSVILLSSMIDLLIFVPGASALSIQNCCPSEAQSVYHAGAISDTNLLVCGCRPPQTLLASASMQPTQPSVAKLTLGLFPPASTPVDSSTTRKTHPRAGTGSMHKFVESCGSIPRLLAKSAVYWDSRASKA